MRFNNVAAALLLCAGVSWSPLAGAINPDAQTFFAQGRQLRKDGKCQEAIVVFRRAFDLAPEGLGALRNVAECEEELGQFASARIDWWNLRRAALQSNDPKYEGWEKDAEDAYNKLEPKVGRLTIAVNARDLSKVTVTMDGTPVDPRLFGAEIERDLGPHTIEASYGSVAPITEKITLTASKKEVVTLEIPSSIPSAEPPPEAAPDRRRLRVGGYVSLGLGGAGLIGLVSSIAVRQSAASTVEEMCGPPSGGAYSCPKSVEGDVDSGKTASALVNVFAGVAIAGAGVGVALLMVSGSGSAPPAKTGAVVTDVNVRLAPGGAWITGRF